MQFEPQFTFQRNRTLMITTLQTSEDPGHFEQKLEGLTLS
jgi:hypothetical protein